MGKGGGGDERERGGKRREVGGFVYMILCVGGKLAVDWLI